MRYSSAGCFFIPNISRSRPANIRGLLRTTIFIMYPFRYNFSRNIPRTISSTATVMSSTLTEKNEMHITAPRKAANASRTPVVQPRLRFFGPRTASPPALPRPLGGTATYYSRGGILLQRAGDFAARSPAKKAPPAAGKPLCRRRSDVHAALCRGLRIILCQVT